MPFWERVKDDITKAAKEGWEVAKGGAKIAAGKSKEVAAVGKLRYKAFTNHKKAERLFCDLGGAVYESAKPPHENPLSKSSVMKIVEAIRKLEEEAAKIAEEIQKTKKAFQEKRKTAL